MTFRVSDLVTNLSSRIPLEASCGGYTNNKPNCPTEPTPSPPANPSQDFYPGQVPPGLEALGQLRQALRMHLN